MNMKKLAVVSLLGVSALGMAGSANAACAYNGKIERIQQYNNGAYVYLESISSVNPTSVYFFWTTDPEFMRAAHAAFDGQSYVYATGNRSTCGTGANRYMGSATYIVRY